MKKLLILLVMALVLTVCAGSNAIASTLDEAKEPKKTSISKEGYNAAIAVIDAANAYIARPEFGMWRDVITTEAWYEFAELESKQQ